MIDIRDVTKTYGTGTAVFKALDSVSVTVGRSEFFTLLGPSGCGKTTLLRIIAGFVDPTGGSLHLDGDDLLTQPPNKRPVNTVFQNYALFPHMTVAQNIGFGLKMLGQPAAQQRAAVSDMLDLVQMTALADRRTSEISGGQQQRVALARALAPQPKVLLLDEPLSALDFKLRKEMQIELKRLQSETGITFVFVTHDQEEALTMSDRIAVMNAGSIRQIGAPRDIYDRPQERFVADFIGETNFLTVAVLGAVGETAHVRLPSGQDIRVATAGQPAATGQATMAVRPEHTALVDPDHGALSGHLTNIVYSGTDMQFHVTLADGAPFVVRGRVPPGQTSAYQTGQQVGIRLDAHAGQLLQD